jgi:outer membrane protein OmpA-like peptidoglycan-associated protein
MKQSNNTFAYVMLLCLGLAYTQQVSAQGYGDPLTFQGLGHTTTQSAVVRGAGGITFGLKNDVSVMFLNPASLTSLQGIQFSLGGLQQSTYAKQDQCYGGLQTHSAFGPLVEATTGSISDPDTNAYYNGVKVSVRTQADSVQRPFDSILPDWNRSKGKGMPVQFLAAAPFSLGGIRMVGGVGAIEYANLSWYYQNNNCFSPSVLSVMNGTIATGPLNANPYAVQWYQYSQQRDGSIYGYGAALSAALTEQLSVGVSGMVLKGSTDDKEVRVGRGRMLFFTSSLRLDRPGTTSYTKTGTSDYSGMELTLSGEYKSRYFDAGFSIKPPTTITRSFSSATSQDSVAASKTYLSKIDSIHVYSNTTFSGEDKMALPWRGTVGVGFKLNENVTFGISYEIRSYASAEYTDASGSVTSPWLSSSVLHVGGEYRASPWLMLRAGVTNYAEVFQPLSAGIRGQPVGYPVYALGVTVTLARAALNLAYEYSDMKYIDTWSNAVSINRQITNNIVASFSYNIVGGKTAVELQEEELKKQLSEEQQRKESEMRLAEDKSRREMEARKAKEEQERREREAQKALEEQKALEAQKAKEAQKQAETPVPKAEPPKAEQPAEVKSEIKFEPVYFRIGSLTLSSLGRRSLDAAVKVLQDNPSVNVEVSGHADSMGSRAVNVKISDARAEAVKKYIVLKGVSGGRLTAKGYAFDKPAASNTTVEGRRLNRRAELEVMK